MNGNIGLRRVKNMILKLCLPTASSMAANFSFAVTLEDIQPRPKVRPIKKAAQAPSVEPIETMTVPAHNLKMNPAPSVQIEPGSNSTQAIM